ncbi:hepatitis A virus cellular receptor 2-like [Ornithorhynchus anatinus]|uniref:hepatitis A virus cellular receptor 2-like n=1 Tax=Ornithorhynchus anatinus TaxID=9258 RepID=UPI0019D46266|nr:hepatitis A virus cellular receptor 2-like [Ornithorhynchus anatinus]
MSIHFFFRWILMLLLVGCAASGQTVGVMGLSVTLPCSYSVPDETHLTSMCWGRGVCPLNRCGHEIIWTDGREVTYRRSSRYQLKGDLLKGEVSLTIANVTDADGGMYCCRVECTGWFNDKKVNLQLVIEQASNSTALLPAKDFPSEIPTYASTEGFNSASNSTTLSSVKDFPLVIPTHASTERYSSGNVLDRDALFLFLSLADFIVRARQYVTRGQRAPFISTLRTEVAGSSETSVQMNGTQSSNQGGQCCPIAVNVTVTQTSEGLRNRNQTEMTTAPDLWMTSSKGLYIGVSVFAGALLSLLLVILIFKWHIHNRKKMQSLSLISLYSPPPTGIRTAMESGIHAEENAYTIEENVYTTEENEFTTEENAYIIE